MESLCASGYANESVLCRVCVYMWIGAHNCVEREGERGCQKKTTA